MMTQYDAQLVEADAKREWQSRPEVRAEFVSESIYVAFCKARAAGSFRIHGPGAKADTLPRRN